MHCTSPADDFFHINRFPSFHLSLDMQTKIVFQQVVSAAEQKKCFYLKYVNGNISLKLKLSHVWETLFQFVTR